MKPLSQTILESRRRLLRMHFERGVGHIGGNLSCLEILMVLHHRVLRSQDLFVLSKGHAAGALYITLWSLGRLSDKDLEGFHGEATHLSGHPAPGWREDIPFATGSLGHGFPLANGLALGRKLQRQEGRIFCLLSDGEWEEGSNWEAVLFCLRHQLGSLTLVVDWNGLQGFGTTREVGGLDSVTGRLRAFGMAVEEVDGHDPEALERVLGKDSPEPRAVIAHTKKGHGVSFMEDRMEWHYLPMTEEQYRLALQETEAP